MKSSISIILVIGILVIGGIWWSKSMQNNDPDVLSKNGFHWHPILEVFVKGEKQSFPNNLGVGNQYASLPTFDPSMRMTAIHTHDDASENIVHMEFSGVVRKDDTKLENFFKIWGKDMSSLGSDVSMTVNGEPNAELGNYQMKDGDKIILNYE